MWKGRRHSSFFGYLPLPLRSFSLKPPPGTLVPVFTPQPSVLVLFSLGTSPLLPLPVLRLPTIQVLYLTLLQIPFVSLPFFP